MSTTTTSAPRRDELVYPYTESDVAAGNAISLDDPDAINALCDAVIGLSHSDRNTIAGTMELAHRTKEVKELINSLYHTQPKLSPEVQPTVRGVLTALSAARTILNRALTTRFRRHAKYKESIRITLNELVITIAKLTALQLGTRTNPPPSPPPVSPGLEECLAGDKAFFGHGEPVDYVRAHEMYRLAAEKGNVAAMNSLATMYREGVGVRSRDLAKALDLYQKAADGGSLDALNNIAGIYESGEGVVKNLETAIEYYQRAANGGHVDSACNLGYIYEHGSEDDSNYVPIDIDAAAAWYNEASEKGYAKAQNNLGYLHFIGAIGGAPDYARAIHWFQRAAEQGNAGALNNLGICYESGRGVPRNEELAIQCYSDAAQQQHPAALSSLGYLSLKNRQFAAAFDYLSRAAQLNDKEAHYHLAQMYHHGLHVTKSDTTAFTYYTKAAEQGHPYALLEVGHALFSGRGCPRDPAKAFAFYKQSALANVSEAENSVGILMEEGVGVVKDIEGALYWYRRAEARGNADAMYNLAMMLENGRGCEPDLAAALAKYRLAAEAGSMQAKVRLEQEKVRQFAQET